MRGTVCVKGHRALCPLLGLWTSPVALGAPVLRGSRGYSVRRHDGEQSLRLHPAPCSSSKSGDEAARFQLGLWLVFLRTRPHPEMLL